MKTTTRRRSYRDGILRRLENLRKRYPAHYAQIAVLPFSMPPAYAMEDTGCPWWKSDEAANFFESLNENNLHA